MKRFFVFLLLSIMFSTALVAQNAQQKQPTTRKVPFLPYAGVVREDERYRTTGPVAAQQSSTLHDTSRTIFFDKESTELRPDQRKKLLEIGKRMERDGVGFYYIRAFTSPEASQGTAERRAGTVANALADFKIGQPIFNYEHRKSPVINPNRVEVLW